MSNLASCPDCRNMCSLAAVSCPKCGRVMQPGDLTPPDEGEPKKRIGGIVVLALMALLVLLLIFAGRQPSQREVDGAADRWIERNKGR
jgi:predicted anti-sigma-YlaC factor YlaD